MISEGIMHLLTNILSDLPVISLGSNFSAGLNFLMQVIGFINVFIPLNKVLPILVMLILIRGFNIVMAVINWIIRLIPFIG
ncbi:MAG: hypothetical protein DBX40_01830 [Clostridiales bacterium]|nr:MAG: hypothetical protein DBX40_01830 [Clostridiales bacterium]